MSGRLLRKTLCCGHTSLPSLSVDMRVHSSLPCCVPIMWCVLCPRCGIDVGPSKAHIAQHLAAGAVVLPEDFLVQLLKLLSSPQDLAQQLDRTDAPLHGILAQALFATGEGCADIEGDRGWVQD